MMHYRNQSLKLAQNLKSAGWGSFSKCLNFYIEFYQVREWKSPSWSPRDKGKGSNTLQWAKESWAELNPLFPLLLLTDLQGVTPCSSWGSFMRFQLPFCNRGCALVVSALPSTPPLKTFPGFAPGCRNCSIWKLHLLCFIPPKATASLPCSPLVSSALQPRAQDPEWVIVTKIICPVSRSTAQVLLWSRTNDN